MDRTEPQRVLEIDTGRKGRWWRFGLWVILLLAVAAAVVWMFVRFGTKLGMACFLVAFMIGYMLLMGRWAEKNIERKP